MAPGPQFQALERDKNGHLVKMYEILENRLFNPYI